MFGKQKKVIIKTSIGQSFSSKVANAELYLEWTPLTINAFLRIFAFFFEINFFWTKYLKVERFEYKGIFKTLSKIDGALYIVTIFAERSILDVWESSKYASE